MAGGFGAPFRAPCGGWSASPKRWGGLSHVRNAEKNIVKWANVTAVRDYSALATYIPPYHLLVDVCNFTFDSCDPVACATTPTEGTQPCYPLDLAYWLQAPAETADLVKIGTNYFARTVELLDHSACRKMGWTAAQAEKAWHGMPGFFVCACTPFATKYLALEVTAGMSVFGIEDFCTPADPPTGTTDADALHMANAVAGNTGNRSQSVCTYTSDFRTDDPSRTDNYYAPHIAGIRFACDHFATTDSSGSPNNDQQITTMLVDVLNAKLGGAVTTAQFHAAAPSAAGFYKFEFPTWTVTNTLIDVVAKLTAPGNCVDPPQMDASIWTFNLRLELSSPYTLDDVLDDLKEMLALWPLNDPRSRLRMDGNCALVPLVSRDEAAAPVSPDFGLQNDFNPAAPCFSTTDPFTGAIKGAPLPVGYEGYYNFDHPTYCLRPSGYCVEKRGAMSGTGPEPPSATQWQNNLWAALLRPGAWVEYGTLSTLSVPVFDKVRAQKWAEIMMPWPSVQLNRPAGRDRAALDPDASECIVSYGAPTLELEADIAVTGTELFAIVSSADGLDGIYECTRPGAAQLDVGDRRWAIPDWMPYAHDGVASKLRWPDKRGIYATAGVASATDNADGTVTVVVSEDVFLFGRHLLDDPAPGTPGNGESLVFTGVAGLTTNEVISASGLRTFLVAGALSGAYAGGGTVVCAGYAATDDRWHDDNPKRQYVTREWALDGTLTETQQCKYPIPCAPTVICWSPNAEVFEHGNTHGMAFTGFESDECNTSLLAYDFLTVETDPFWKRPPAPRDGPWQGDDGSCINDYAHGPVVEPLLTLPSGAPALAAGITLHTAQTFPPAPGTCGAAPWALWMRFKNSTATESACAFKEEYKRWFRGCL